MRPRAEHAEVMLQNLHIVAASFPERGLHPNVERRIIPGGFSLLVDFRPNAARHVLFVGFRQSLCVIAYNSKLLRLVSKVFHVSRDCDLIQKHERLVQAIVELNFG
jgi:hypothetical protein